MAVPQSLKDLFAAADKARQAFHAHKYEGLPDDLDAKLAHDLEDRKLLDASSKARIAYERARDEYLSQEAT